MDDVTAPEQPIWWWRYQLASSGALNRASDRRLHEGVLIRAGRGHGCIHPWPELGDPPLEDELVAIKQGRPLPLGRAALTCAVIDATAREQGAWLFNDFDMPASHALWTQAEDEPAGQIDKRVDALLSDGFEAVKIKAGKPLPALLELLERVHAAAAGRLTLRLDFNATLDADSLRQFAGHLSPTLRQAIEFVEDPLPYRADEWGRLAADTGLRLALDRDLGHGTDGYQVAVVKPSTLTASGWIAAKHLPMILTSSMQHPVGQLYDAWMSRVFTRSPDHQLAGCGLLTHECYVPDPFIERMQRRGPVLVPPPGGTGLGFDDLLDALPWNPLT